VGFSAAVLFGASAPFWKMLLDDVGPQMLAGLLYLGAFLAVIPFVRSGARRGEASLRRSDVPRLAGIVLSGGVIAPVLLMLGLERVSGISGSLLLNLEGPFTLLVGVVVLHEYLGRRSAVGSPVIFACSACIGLQGFGGAFDALGGALIVAACAGWAIDNNLTQQLSVRDSFQIIAVKADTEDQPERADREHFVEQHQRDEADEREVGRESGVRADDSSRPCTSKELNRSAAAAASAMATGT
jgi:drug/metabolite transporter (DMT)-like permease